ncbi:hypothetical protein G9464_06860 [Halostella sp. JP-L12]|uniref:hypothetical protein n=1 Tax=Halostella TaxID=1843185 RepID=UPI0013CF330B|nr:MULTISPECIES: hypothetical protein [Halostella]NHN47317.1 hypothetical protein [Halostella sp. JP-L12]
MIELGRCVDCGHVQPGTKRGRSVDPLAEGGCAKCENCVFEVADAEDASIRPRLAVQ